ncbi:MAG: cytochrome P450 [Actinomycetota bacterium]|nr:cytochrome P450 [Acidimicrobiia bacterium]MDQ3294622.1 cytochrome P450 [Actinomycetota bacterium]
MSNVTADEAGLLFSNAARWADMDEWHARAAELRRTTPVVRVERAGFLPFWALTRHADVFAVSREDSTWQNTPRSVLGPEEEWERMVGSGMPVPATLVHLDGDEHRKHRQVTNDWFKPAVVGRRQERIDELADLYIERMRELGGTCDFAKDVAEPYTLRVIMDIYGVPEEDEPLMLELTQGIFGAADPEFMGDAEDPGAKVLETVMRFVQYFNELTEDRRASPRDDLASVIANGEIDGCPMEDVPRLWYYIIVATAGHDTTSYALSGGMEAMLRDPSQLRALRDEPDLIVNAADEVIRWTSPVRHFMRYATRDTEVGGVGVAAGERVLLSYPSANRDEDVFADSMTFDVRRPDADKLLSFGVGPHFCLGAQFARREIRTMLGKLSAQLALIEPAGEPSWAESHFVSGVKHLPVSYSFRP